MRVWVKQVVLNNKKIEREKLKEKHISYTKTIIEKRVVHFQWTARLELNFIQISKPPPLRGWFKKNKLQKTSL